MGIVRFIIRASVLASLSAPGLAQDNSAAPVLQGFRLDPARDPNRAAVPQRAGPEIDNRVLPNLPAPVPIDSRVRAPVLIKPTVKPTLVQPLRAPSGRPVTRAQIPAGRAPQSPAQFPAQPPVADTPDSAVPASGSSGSVAPAPDEAPAASGIASGAAPWPWIIGGLVILGGIILLTGRRRRAKATGEPERQSPVIDAAMTQTPMTEASPMPDPAPPVPSPARRPVEPVRAIPPSVPAAIPDPVALHFTPVHAQMTLTGAVLGYRLTLHNRSDNAIEGLSLSAFMASADAHQPQVVAAFFDDAFAPEAHRVAALAPGAQIVLEGELRISRDRLTPIDVQGRALWIPVVAFKAVSMDGDRLARGAFVVGQESTPPRARMGGFRIDQGPRQFRDVGSRPAQGLIAA